MNGKEIVSGIVIPIVSAFVGGGLTLIGVLITITFENKKRKEEIRLANKPLFYIIDPYQTYDQEKTSEFAFFPEFDEKTTGWRTLIFKNTDNAILILDYLKINGKNFFPKNGNVVDKNTVFIIYVHNNGDVFEKNENEIVFGIKDSLKNKYMYNLEYTNERGKILKGYSEIE